MPFGWEANTSAAIANGLQLSKRPDLIPHGFPSVSQVSEALPAQGECVRADRSAIPPEKENLFIHLAKGLLGSLNWNIYMSCVHSLLNSALDRWQESHWHLHQVESNYHSADPFRYSMNSFIRVIREIPDIVSKELQNRSGFTKWHRPIKDSLEKDDLLIRQIIDHRNFIVHKAMLVPGSECYIATIRGDTVKMGISFPIDPFENSEDAVKRFLNHARRYPEILSLLAPDEIQMIGVVRTWKIRGIETEVVCAFRKAWSRIGKYLSDVLVFLEGEPLEYENMPCFKDLSTIQQRKFPSLNEQLLERAKNDS